MNPRAPEDEGAAMNGIREVAARWVVRQDRSLSPAEKAEWSAWLAADPRHAAAFARSAAAWQRTRDLALAVHRVPGEAARPRAKGAWLGLGGLAAAAAGVALFFGVVRGGRDPQAGPEPGRAAASAQAPATRRFADGSVARLRNGAEVSEAYSSTERRVRLVRGEAFFAVRKDAARPFLVEVGHVTVRAVGTSFAVRMESSTVDVLVTEGRVKVTPSAPAPVAAGGGAGPDASALVEAGHRAVVARTPEPAAARVVVTAVSEASIARSLAWNDPMLDFAGTTLGEVVAAFAQRTGRRIEIGDPTLAAVRMGGRFPTDDVDGFVRVLEEIYDVKAERRADASIVLRKAR